jgi:hypothetical protein
MTAYNTKVYSEQGGDALVVRAADGGVIKGQASAGGTPAQAAAITDLAVTGTYSTDDTPIETAVNSILAALRNAGIIAAS